MLMTVIWFILIGAVIGLLARLLIPGRNSIGTLMTILVGVVGAVVGGMIAGAVGAGSVLAFVFAVVIAAILVALLSGGGRRHRVFQDITDRVHGRRPASSTVGPDPGPAVVV